MVVETSFPRGGNPEPSIKVSSHKTDYDLFGKKKRKSKKIDLRNEMGAVNVVEKNICTSELTKTSVDLPNYKSIREGMLFLGAIREIQKMAINILLPGRISGRVMITQISEPYTKLLKQIAENRNPTEFHPIKTIYAPGQHVAIRVVRINNEDEKCQIQLSMDPRDINSDLGYQNLVAGMVLWGAISDIEEHGYVVELGIKNTRAFLPKSNLDDDTKYYKGQTLWCVLQKYVIDGSASIATLNVRRDKIDSTLIIKDVSLNYLLPGMHVDLTVSKILSNGLEVKFLNDFLGYVSESYLQNESRLERYRVGQVVQGRILYIEPVTKITYLTLKKFNSLPGQGPKVPDLVEGSTVTGAITALTRGGLYIKFNKNLKGFVSFKRLKTQLPITADLDYNDLVRKNYKIGSTHECRILGYDYMEGVYTCTMQKELLKESTFCSSDLKLDQIVTAEVKEIQKNGLLVQIGRVSAFILNEHLTESNLASYDKFKSKFHPGQKLKAKVFNINNNSILLTLKPTLLKSTNLSDYKMAAHNKQYPGIVVQITQNGILVRFFGDVKGWVPKTQLSFEKVERPDKMFKIGQIVNCTIIKCDKTNLTLSLHPPKVTSKKRSLKLGQGVNVKVVEILPNALQVETLDTHVGAVVPALYLSDFTTIATPLLKTYNVGDVISDLTCVNVGHGVPLLRKFGGPAPEFTPFDEVKADMILPCSLHSINKDGLLLSAPIKDFEKFIFVPSNRVSEMTQKINNLKLQRYQKLYARVTKIQKNNQHLYGSCELSKVWDGDLSFAEKMLSGYLLEVQLLKERLENPLNAFKMGQVVKGVVTKIKKGKFVNVEVGDVIGKIQMQNLHEGVKIGDEVSATVLWVNYHQNLLELVSKETLKSKVNHIQNGNIKIKVGKNALADVLLVKKEFVLVSLRGNGNRQLAFLPAQLHFNDLIPNTHVYKVGNEIKVQILQVDDGKIIGISKEVVKNFEKAKKAVKRARVESESRDGKKAKLETETGVGKKRKNDTHETTTKKVKIADEENDVEIEEEQSSSSDDVEKGSDNESDGELKNNDDLEDSDSDFEQIDLVSDDNDEGSDDVQEMNVQNGKSLSEESGEESEEEAEQTVVEEKVSKKNKKMKSEDTEVKTKPVMEDKVQKKADVKITPVLSGVNSFWETPKAEKVIEESSEEEEKDDDEEFKKKQKKKKLTSAEKSELARIEEERLRKIETELADQESAPKNADQFDRLVLANPNNSLLWINYIAFHLEATEIEKARAIARKALKTIEFREEQEKLNVWIAFLNLENRYGSKESFLTILEEALKMNDALTIHLQALNILAESNKTSEFLELLNKVTKRYKQEAKMWIGAAESCYKCDQKDQARNLMQRAVKSLDEKQHVNLIVQFAFMESKWGETERAEAILEKVLASYPKRVDIWCSYVDMLIKADRIHVARNVLERAVSQKLPPKKVKTLFSKFVKFEKLHGDEERVKNVRQLASEYVEKALK